MSNPIIINPETGEQFHPIAELPKELEPDRAAKIQLSFHNDAIAVEGLIYITAQILESKDAKEAGEVRKQIKSIKSRVTKHHKVEKEYYLRAGQFCDAIKKKLITQLESMDADLDLIENAELYAEQKRKAELRDARWGELSKYHTQYIPGIEDMEESAFQLVLQGAKQAYEERVKAELERENAEKMAAEIAQKEQERVRLKLQEEQERLQTERLALQKEQERIDAIKRAEQVAEEKRKAEAARLAALPLLEKKMAWVDSFQLPEIDLASPDVEVIKARFDSFKKWAKTQLT